MRDACAARTQPLVLLVGIRDADVNLEGDEAQARGQHHVLGARKQKLKTESYTSQITSIG
jgi:hypothetical protein